MNPFWRIVFTAFVSLVLSLFWQGAIAQRVSTEEFSTWAARNNFVPGTDWRSYLLIAPGNMGPNALPIPSVTLGVIDTLVEFSVRSSIHRAVGDRSFDLTGQLQVPFGQHASLRVRYHAQEWYSLSQERIENINALVAPGSGRVAGDVHVEGFFQVTRDKPKWPDIVLAIRSKTASGGGLEALRYTDSPAYGFDAAFAKTYDVGEIEFRPYFSGGFYVWQRFGQSAPQNDAYSYGFGSRLMRSRMALQLEAVGYTGWTERSDNPLLIRIETVFRLSNQVSCSIHGAYGIRDYPFKTLGIQLAYRWPSNK